MTPAPSADRPPTTAGSPDVRPHLPVRPLWLCRVCAGPWPCATARLSLIREYVNDRTALCIYLGGVLYDAVTDLYQLNPHDAPDPRALFERFIGWAPPRHPS